MAAFKKKLNLILTSGLLVVSAKFRDGAPVVTLFVTDYTNNTRVLFDLEHKKILANRDGIEMNGKDIELLMIALETKEPVKVDEKAAPSVSS